MKKEELFETIEQIDKKYLEIADTFKPKKKRAIWVNGLAAVACLALILSLTSSKFELNDSYTGYVAKIN